LSIASASSQGLFADSQGEGYKLRLDAFEGPLDLLLHLIRKNELDIYNVPIAEVTRQYLEYLNLMKELNLDIAGEFLVMASTLIQIKSRQLLPAISGEDEPEEDEEDPRAELIRRLLEYQKYKEAAAALNELEMLGREQFARKFPAPELASVSTVEEVAEVGLFELIEALKSVLARIPVESFHEVGAEPVSLADRIGEILLLLEGKEGVPFEDLLPLPLTREGVIVTFLAMLELCRLKMVKISQNARFGAIWISSLVLADDSGVYTEGSFDYTRS